MFVTTLAPMTFPYLLKSCFKSVARDKDDKPDTQRLRLKALLPAGVVGEGAVIFVFSVEVLLFWDRTTEAVVAGASVISAIIRTENRKLIFNWFCLASSDVNNKD